MFLRWDRLVVCRGQLINPLHLLDNRGYMVPRVLAVFLTVFSAFAAAEVKVIEQIVAKFNGDIITRGELEHSRQAMEADLKQQKVPEAKFHELLKGRQAHALKD